MSDEYESVCNKVSEIFAEFGQNRARNLEPNIPARTIKDSLATALSADYPIEIADQIAFHLVDWNADAALLVALHLFPERFTPEEMRTGIEMFLIHAPAHVIEAARLGGYPTENIFTEGDDEPDGT
jgi:hypothetical protein